MEVYIDLLGNRTIFRVITEQPHISKKQKQPARH